MQFTNPFRLRFLWLVFFVLCFVFETGFTQTHRGRKHPPREALLAESVRQLQLQIQQLQTSMQEMRSEANRDRAEASAENMQLKQELKATRDKLDSMQASLQVSRNVPQDRPGNQMVQPTSPDSESAGVEKDEQRIAKLEEDQQLLAGKIDEQYQTKIESASKYRVKLSGLILMNLFSNRGNIDYFEIPVIALPTTASLTGGNTGGSFGATIRQSELGVEVFGQVIAGARTQGHFVADFLGDFPDTLNGFST